MDATKSTTAMEPKGCDYERKIAQLEPLHTWLQVPCNKQWQTNMTRTTGCIKKKVIELQRAIVSELLYVATRFFHIRKDHAFSCWMISSSCQFDKKWANTYPIKNVSQNRIFSPLRVGSKTIENEPPLVLKLMNFTSINYTHIRNYY
jgi:hypothetical protein